MIRGKEHRNAAFSIGLGLVLGLGGCECDETSNLTALTGELEVRDGRRPSAEQTPITELDIGEVPLGVPARVPLVAANIGTNALVVCVSEGVGCSAGSAFEPREGPFLLRLENPGDSGWEVAVNQSREFAVRFLPSAEGPVEATLVLRHDGANGPETRILVRGVGVAPQVDIAPTTLDFGPVTVGRRRSLTLELTNRTPFAQPIEVPAFDQTTVIFGVIDDAGNQVPTGQALMSSVPGNGTMQLTVFFQPELEQSYSDNLEVRFCPTCTQTVSLLGSGIKPLFEVTPVELDFGDVDETQSETRTFSVRNLSDQYPVTVASVEVAGMDPQFVTTPREMLPRALAPMETLIVEVTYMGTTPAEHEGRIDVRTNAWDDPDTGLDESVGAVALRGRTLGPNIDAFPDTVTFGTVAINAAASSRTLSIQNVGTAPLSVSEIQFNSTSAELNLVNAPGRFPQTLAPGASLDLQVTYRPTDPGLDRADVVIRSDDRDEPMLTVPVTGIGGVPTTCAVSVAPSQVTFGLVERGRVANLPVEIRNAGAQPCALSNLQLSGDAEFTLPAPPTGVQTVAPGQRLRVDIAYAPTQYGNHTATLAFEADDPSQAMVQVPIRGSSDQSEVLVIPSQVDFNVVPVRCRSPIRQVTVYNTGASSVQVTRVYLDPTTTPEFELTAVPTPLTIRAGASTTIDLRYRPNDIGQDTGVLFIEHSAASAPVAVPLTGDGQINPTVTDTFNQLPAPQADVLFVVDNSCSMSEEQSSLGGNLGAFLQFARQQNIDFHIGVVTTDVARNTDSGRFRGNPRIIDPSTPNGDTTFRNTVRLGTGGSASERGLEAAYLALSDPLINTHNAGFLRQNAALAVIFVSDEPDFSTRPVTFYENFLRNIKGFNNTGMFSASAVVGTQSPRCNGPGGRATYAPRYIGLAQNSGGVVESICAANWGQTLANIGLNSFGLRRQFTLSSQPVPATIAVRVDGASVPRADGSGVDNWTFDSTTNTITFATTRVPAEGATITVTYSVACLP